MKAMKIAVIVATDLGGGIGFLGRLPWGRIPADLKRFRKLTMGYPLIMGRTTFESLPAPLPGRPHIILTRQTGYKVSLGCYVAHYIGHALAVARSLNLRDRHLDGREPRVFVVGGAEVYGQVIHTHADYLYMTRIDAMYRADTFFPSYNKGAWILLEPPEIAEWEGIKLSFEVYGRLTRASI